MIRYIVVLLLMVATCTAGNRWTTGGNVKMSKLLDEIDASVDISASPIHAKGNVILFDSALTSSESNEIATIEGNHEPLKTAKSSGILLLEQHLQDDISEINDFVGTEFPTNQFYAGMSVSLAHSLWLHGATNSLNASHERTLNKLKANTDACFTILKGLLDAQGTPGWLYTTNIGKAGSFSP